MAAIKCKECGFMISDPCVLMNSLFSARLMSERHEFLNFDITETKKRIADRLEKELGLTDLEFRYEQFKHRINDHSLSNEKSPIVFTLKCLAGHQNKYILDCN